MGFYPRAPANKRNHLNLIPSAERRGRPGLSRHNVLVPLNSHQLGVDAHRQKKLLYRGALGGGFGFSVYCEFNVLHGSVFFDYKDAYASQLERFSVVHALPILRHAGGPRGGHPPS